MLNRISAERDKRKTAVYSRIRSFCSDMEKRGRHTTVALFGSYTRSDFNTWSDIDLIVVSEFFEDKRFILRARYLRRLPPETDAICWTPEEARKMFARPNWKLALATAVVFTDHYNLFSQKVN